MFKTELHCHTAGVSACGRLTEERLVERYVEEGYSTVVLTNHLSIYTYKNDRIDGTDWSWKEKINYYMDGYHRFSKAAEGKLLPILGCEFRSNLDGNEYLLYGVTEEMLRSIPDMMDERLEHVRSALHSIGGLMYQAHPFRTYMQVKSPKLIDGVEVFNANTSRFRNEIAMQWAEHYGLLRSSGSDTHGEEHIICGGIETTNPIKTREELIAALRSPETVLLAPLMLTRNT